MMNNKSEDNVYKMIDASYCYLFINLKIFLLLLTHYLIIFIENIQ